MKSERRHIGGLILGLGLRHLVWVGTLAAVVAIWLLSSPTTLPGPLRGDQTIRIVAANLNTHNPKAREASAKLARLQATLLILIEWNGQNLNLDDFIDFTPVLNVPRPGTHGMLILGRDLAKAESRLHDVPVTHKCRLPMGTLRWAQEGQIVSLLAVHVPPPVAACGSENEAVLDWMADQVESGSLISDVGVAKRGDPLILAGDFNAWPLAGQIRKLTGLGLQDTFAEMSWVPRGTWSPRWSLPKLLRIDYVLASREISTEAAYVVDLPGSDHRAVVADIQISKERNSLSRPGPAGPSCAADGLLDPPREVLSPRAADDQGLVSRSSFMVVRRCWGSNGFVM
jgi:endonuclease/exonuclease/phosphatase family metal-dependent hydrolase